MSQYAVFWLVVNFDEYTWILGVHMCYAGRFPLPPHFITAPERLLHKICDHRSFPIVQFARRHNGFPELAGITGRFRFLRSHNLIPDRIVILPALAVTRCDYEAA